jgi:hypothetical protein
VIVLDGQRKYSKGLHKEMTDMFQKYRMCRYLVAENNEYQDYCQMVEYVVNLLPEKEKEVIMERYMKDDYVKDYHVYYDLLMISQPTFSDRRNKAFERLDLYLRTFKMCG